MDREASFPGPGAPARGGPRSQPPDRAEPPRALPWSGVWTQPLLKGMGFCCILGCVAWLGQKAGHEASYGPEVAQAPAPPASEQPTASGGSTAKTPEASSGAAPPPCVGAASGSTASTAPKPSAFLPDGRLVLSEAT